MADSTSSESSPFSGSYYSDFEASMESEHDERVYESVGEIRPSQFEPLGRMLPKIEGEGQKRIKSPCAAAASIAKARMVSAFAIVKKNLKISCLLIVGAIN